MAVLRYEAPVRLVRQQKTASREQEVARRQARVIEIDV
jgi:hypothetical protein